MRTATWSHIVLLVVATGGQAAVALAQAAKPHPDMSFFVTSRSVDGSANLGGLAGADRHCQQLASAVGAGSRTWRAYLSVGPQGVKPAINARDRIGRGPWLNVNGVVMARDLAELHGDNNKLDRHTVLTEHGERIRTHDILTGSDSSGRLAFSAGHPATCANWTAAGAGIARIGHHDRFEAASWGNKRFPRWFGSWNSEHFTTGCDAKSLADTGGGGQFYCFASDAREKSPANAPAATAAQFTFKRGLNVNHWLGSNLAPDLLPRSLYGEDWFDEEDIAWIAAQGFDHLRFRVGGHYWITKEGDIDEARMVPFDKALHWAKQHGLGVVVSMDALPGFRMGVRGEEKPADQSSPFTDAVTRGDAAYLWWLVARRYAGEGEALRFELLHSPDAEDAEQMRTFNRAMLAAIRRTSPRRMVYLTSHDASLDSVEEVELSDPYTALAVDFWEPRVFTFQADEKLPLAKFPGRVPDLQALLEKDDPTRLLSRVELTPVLLDVRIKDFAERIAPWIGSHEVYVSQWGVYHRADDASARNYVRAAKAAFERHGLNWAVYDYHTGCAVRGEDGKPTRVLEALQPLVAAASQAQASAR